MVGTKRVSFKINGKQACVKSGGGVQPFSKWLQDNIWSLATSFKKLMMQHKMNYVTAVNKFPCEDAKERRAIARFIKNLPSYINDEFLEALDNVTEHKKK